jgi:CRP-like cAMP-binding protein
MPPALPPLFQSLNDVDVYTALRHFREVDVGDGQTVLEEGTTADTMLIVVAGALDLSARGVWLGRAEVGDIVGETSLFEHKLRTATATAHGATRLMVLERSGYERLRDVLHPMAQVLEATSLDLQVARLRNLGDRIAELSEGQRQEPRMPGAGFFSAVTNMFGRGGIFSAETIDTLVSLRKCPPFADVEEEVLGPIADRLTPVVYGAGAFVCTEGEMSDQMFFLDEGDVDVVVATQEDRVQHLTTLKPGAAFGMVTLAQRRPRMSSCIARTRVVALALDLESWEALIADPYFTGSVFRRAMIRVLAEQVGYTNRQLAALSEAAMDTTGKIRRATAALEAHGEYLARTTTPAPRR